MAGRRGLVCLLEGISRESLSLVLEDFRPSLPDRRSRCSLVPISVGCWGLSFRAGRSLRGASR